MSELCQDRVLVSQSIRDKVYTERGAVERDWTAISVDDPATTGWNDLKVNPVAFCEKCVLFVLCHGEPSHASGEQHANPHLRAPKEEGAS